MKRRLLQRGWENCCGNWSKWTAKNRKHVTPTPFLIRFSSPRAYTSTNSNTGMSVNTGLIIRDRRWRTGCWNVLDMLISSHFWGRYSPWVGCSPVSGVVCGCDERQHFTVGIEDRILGLCGLIWMTRSEWWRKEDGGCDRRTKEKTYKATVDSDAGRMSMTQAILWGSD